MRKKFTVLDLIFSIGHNSDDIPVTVKTTREEVGTAPSLRWMENPPPLWPRHPGGKGERADHLQGRHHHCHPAERIQHQNLIVPPPPPLSGGGAGRPT